MRPPAQPSRGRPGRRRAAAAGAATGAAADDAPAGRPAAPTPEPEEPTVGSDTGRPLPRFAALGSNQVNMRIGPDLRYSIDWTYQRKDLPVQIVEEYQSWRRIRDPEGTEGWVQRPLLTSRRTFWCRARTRAAPRAGGCRRARRPAEPGVIGASQLRGGQRLVRGRVDDYAAGSSGPRSGA